MASRYGLNFQRYFYFADIFLLRHRVGYLINHENMKFRIRIWRRLRKYGFRQNTPQIESAALPVTSKQHQAPRPKLTEKRYFPFRFLGNNSKKNSTWKLFVEVLPARQTRLYDKFPWKVEGKSCNLINIIYYSAVRYARCLTMRADVKCSGIFLVRYEPKCMFPLVDSLYFNKVRSELFLSDSWSKSA